MHDLQNLKIAIIGLGYVGLPLAVEFSKYRNITGFDIDSDRLLELQKGYDKTLEIDNSLLENNSNLSFSNSPDDLLDHNCYIVTVPTPIDENKNPDLQPLVNASKMLSKILKPNDLVIYESTVFPGATEEICVPALEDGSGLKYNIDFFCGYSPERINPGDKEHRLPNIKKVTSGSNNYIANLVDDLYNSIIEAGTFKASSIKVAEAAKVIENTQRDINIALMNELAIIFNQLDIDTEEVLKAAGSKWNFLPFRPGLVGGHCIGVDPYYLTFKANSIGYHPEVILSGRKINDDMAKYIAQRLIKEMIRKGINVNGSEVLVQGFSFKENCPDIRNTKVIDLIKELKSYSCNVDIFDPWIDPNEAEREYGVVIETNLPKGPYDVIIIAVAHDDFKHYTRNNLALNLKKTSIIFDLKLVLESTESDLRI